MGPIIQEFLLCLLPAAAIGAAVGWALKKLAQEEQHVGITRFELEVKLTAAERKLSALQKDAEIAQQALQDKTAEASFGNEELTQVRAQLAERDELVHGLRTRLSTLESLPVKLATHEATIADLRARLVTLEELPITLRDRDAELTMLRMQLGEMVPKLQLDDRERELKGLIEELEARLANMKATGEQEEAWARQVLSERDGTIQHLHEELARMQRSVAELTSLKATLGVRDETIDSLRDELKSLEASLRDREQLAQTVQARDREVLRVQDRLLDSEQVVMSLRAQVDELQKTVGELEGMRYEAERRQRVLSERDQELAEFRARLEQMVPASEAERLRAKLKAFKQQHAPPAKSNGPEVPKWGAQPMDRNNLDDLTRISGVGPALERLLHKEGVFYFKQIASWTKDDVKVIDKKLDAFKGRILRDNWIKGAKTEHFRKYGERL